MRGSALLEKDRTQIFDLFARYNHYFDDGRGKDWAGCFTPDGKFSGPAGHANGAAELADFCHKTIEKYPVALHFTDHHLFEYSGDVLLHKCILSVQYYKNSSVSILLCRYNDQLVITEGIWKFRSRLVELLNNRD